MMYDKWIRYFVLLGMFAATETANPIKSVCEHERTTIISVQQFYWKGSETPVSSSDCNDHCLHLATASLCPPHMIAYRNTLEHSSG
jgi:hypothetical protein